MSGIISGLAVAGAVLLAGPLAAKLPFCALSSVLIVVAYQLIRVDDIRRTLRATRSDAAVMLATFLCTVFLNIQFSIYIGVLLSIGLHLAKTSHPRIYSVVPDLATGKMVGFVQGQTCCQMDILQIEGSIFFGSAAFVLKDFQHRLRQTVRPESACQSAVWSEYRQRSTSSWYSHHLWLAPAQWSPSCNH